MHCLAGNTALKGNLHESAAESYLKALALNPMLWEAFEGLCAIGAPYPSSAALQDFHGLPGEIPPIENLFPTRSEPILRRPGEAGGPSKSVPVATGAGFFTPEAGNGGNLFRGWKPELRRDAPAGPRDSMSVAGKTVVTMPRLVLTLDSATADSSFYGEPSFQGPIRASRSQPTTLAVQPPAVRPLSSADEAGPVTKKLRSTVRQRTAPPSTTAADTHHVKPSKSAGTLPAVPGPADDRTKSSKARARPALTIANLFSSSGRPAQTAAASSRSHAVGIGKPSTNATARRSTRLQSGGSKIAKVRVVHSSDTLT